ncbi:MAG: hypothetical protein V3V54_03490 [Candidatus Brocadiales bacterium]
MPKTKPERAKALKHKTTSAKKVLTNKKRALASVNKAKSQLVTGGLSSREKRREYSDVVVSQNDLADEIKGDTKNLDDLTDELKAEERTPADWLWYYITYPFRALWDLLKRLSKPLTMAGSEEGLEMLAVELAEGAAIL